MTDLVPIETERVGCWIVRHRGEYAGSFVLYPRFCESYESYEVTRTSWVVVRQ